MANITEQRWLGNLKKPSNFPSPDILFFFSHLPKAKPHHKPFHGSFYREQGSKGEIKSCGPLPIHLPEEKYGVQGQTPGTWRHRPSLLLPLLLPSAVDPSLAPQGPGGRAYQPELKVYLDKTSKRWRGKIDPNRRNKVPRLHTWRQRQRQEQSLDFLTPSPVPCLAPQP